MNATVRNRPALWDIVGEFDSIFDQIVKPAVRAANDTTASAGTRSLAIDVTETDTAYILTGDMPGVKRDELDITIEKGVLTISTKASEKEESSESSESGESEAKPVMIRRERRQGDYRRSLQLADDVAEEYVSASLTDGVLTLTLPKLQKPEPRKIDIQVA